MRLREFNDEGIARFRAALAALREDRSREIPADLLEDDALSAPIVPAAEIEQPGFRTKRDAAMYLDSRLGELPDRRVLRNAGLWTWLTLHYFDDVCPPRAGGRRRVLGDYHYVYQPHDGLHHYRHILAISYRLWKLSPRYSRLMLNDPASRLGAVTEVVARRLAFLRVPCILEVLDRLYFDEGRDRAKRGIIDASNPKPGDLRHRLPARIRQIQKTYDLHSLTADQLIELLGDEFRPWLDQTTAS